MSCQNCWKKLLPFGLTLTFGFFAVALFQSEGKKTVSQSSRVGYGNGRADVINSPLQILAKPRANYTDDARQSDIQGTVTLRVTFLASGEIGEVVVINALPNGLTEQSINAAKGIKFEPAIKNGIPYSITKLVQYNFTLY